jgi:ribose 5-phosphate isomerase A
MAHDNQQDSWKQLVGKEAARLVEDDMLVGLGTGSTANAFIAALGERVRQGLRLRGAVSSSHASQELAASFGVPVTTLDAHPELDLYVDGADEVDPQLQLLKGAGGALLREKVVATSSRRFVVIADVTKQVEKLGSKFPVPVETVPFAVEPVRLRLQVLGATPHVRQIGGKTFMTENGNIILDCVFPGGITNPEELDARLHAIVGVVETGLFLHLAAQVLVGGPEGLITLP